MKRDSGKSERGNNGKGETKCGEKRNRKEEIMFDEASVEETKQMRRLDPMRLIWPLKDRGLRRAQITTILAER